MDASNPHTLFSATGCMRCSIARAFMDQRGTPYEEQDIKAEGKEAFNRFYREHRAEIHRGADGVEFPVLFDGERVVQGVGKIVARLQAEDRLEGFVGRSALGQGWIDGLNVSAGNPSAGEDFLAVLRHLKTHGLQTEVRADGRNGDLLERVVAEGLVDRLVFDPVGPPELYESALGTPLEEEAFRRSLAAAARAPELRFVLTLRPLTRTGGEAAPLSPEEAGRTAQLTAEATGDKQLPLFLQAGEPLPQPVLFKLRTACRRHMPKTDLTNGVRS